VKLRTWDGPTPICWTRRFSSRLRSTVKPSGSPLHRCPQESMGGRTDLQSLAVRPFHVLRH
jgi:hypothetical protein